MSSSSALGIVVATSSNTTSNDWDVIGKFLVKVTAFSLVGIWRQSRSIRSRLLTTVTSSSLSRSLHSVIQ